MNKDNCLSAVPESVACVFPYRWQKTAVVHTVASLDCMSDVCCWFKAYMKDARKTSSADKQIQ